MKNVWRLMFRVGDRKAFDTSIKPILLLIGSECELKDCREYWKNPDLWECTIETPACGESVADQILQVLLIAFRIASGWTIMGSLDEESAEGFGGLFDVRNSVCKSHCLGLEWGEFQIV